MNNDDRHDGTIASYPGLSTWNLIATTTVTVISIDHGRRASVSCPDLVDRRRNFLRHSDPLCSACFAFERSHPHRLLRLYVAFYNLRRCSDPPEVVCFASKR